MPINAMNGNDSYIKPDNISSNSTVKGKGADELGMEDFFNLLVAQMTNQDMLNPKNDTEYIAQMAQFTSLQGIQTIQEYQLSSYAASYVGKNVVISHIDKNNNITKTAGIVQSVSFYDGEPKVVINDVSYPLYSVMEVVNTLPNNLNNEYAAPNEY